MKSPECVGHDVSSGESPVKYDMVPRAHCTDVDLNSIDSPSMRIDS